jgi:hypothetical protein
MSSSNHVAASKQITPVQFKRDLGAGIRAG